MTSTDWKDKIPDQWVRTLLKDKKITLREAELLRIIIPYSTNKSEGCWLCKKSLARELGVSDVRYVRELLSRLLEKNLLEQVGTKRVENKVIPIYKTSFKRLTGGLAPTQFLSSSSSKKNLTSGEESPERTEGGKPSMGFIKEMEPQPDPKLQPIHLELARALKKAYRLNGRRDRVNETSWAKEFRLLLKSEEGLRPSDILKTIETYTRFYKDKYTPVATCAATFRKKYPAIVKAMERKTATEIPDVVISPEAKTIASENGSWGRKVTEAFVQVTFNNVKAYRNRLRLYAEANKGKASARFALDLRERLGRDNSEIWLTVEDWLGHTISWTTAVEFKGNVMAHAFLGTKVRDQYLDKLVRAEGHDPKAYTLLKSKLEAFQG